MTGKQFELEVLNDYEYVIAEFDKDNYYLDDENSAKSLECRLNELFEENEQLRHDATTLICSNQDYRRENDKIKSILLNKIEELNKAYNESARAGMPTGGIIGELDSFEEICRIMGWIE